MDYDDKANEDAPEAGTDDHKSGPGAEPSTSKIRPVLNLGIDQDGTKSSEMSPEKDSTSSEDESSVQFNIRPMGSSAKTPGPSTPVETQAVPPVVAPEQPSESEVIIDPSVETNVLQVDRSGTSKQQSAAGTAASVPFEDEASDFPSDNTSDLGNGPSTDSTSSEKSQVKMGIFGGSTLGFGFLFAKLAGSKAASRLILLKLLAFTFVAPVIGFLCCRSAAMPMAVVSLLISTSLIGFCRRLRVNKLILHSVLFVIASVIFWGLVFPGYGTWHSNYGSFREKLSNLSVTIDDKKSELVDTELSISPTTARGLEYIDHSLNLSDKTKYLILAQLTLFSLAVFSLPLAILMVTPGLGDNAIEEGGSGGFMSWLGSGVFRTFYRIGQFSMVRFGKALVITAVCAIGLRVAGVSGYWFVAGITFAFAILCSLSPLITLSLGLVLAWYADNHWMAMGGVVVTAIALAIAEKVLYKKQDTGIGRVLAWVPHLISVAVLVGLVAGGGYVFKIYNDNATMQKEIRAANQLRQDGNMEGALKAYGAVVEKYPNHPGCVQARYKILTVHIRTEDYTKAMELADELSSYKIEPPTDPKGRIDYKLSEFFDVNGTLNTHRPGLAYEKFVQGVKKSNDQALMSALGQKLLAVEPKNSWAYFALAKSSFLRQDYTVGLAQVALGLECDDNDLDLMLLRAELLYGNGNYPECQDACDEILEMDEYNGRARELMSLIRKNGSTGGGGDEQGQDDDVEIRPEE